MSTDDFRQSTAYLKKAVPLMMKYHIPATPSNYSLWYNYVAERHPELNKDLDETLKLSSVITEINCIDLYQKHLAQDSQDELEQFRLNLEAMATEICHTMKDTLADTDNFQQMLQKRFNKVGRMEEEGFNLEETVNVLRDLVSGASHIQQMTGHFQQRLGEAEAEIYQLRQALKQTQEQASYDALTKLLNRGSFDQEIVNFFELKLPFSLVLVDIDHFKRFNDEYGHLLGDQVLKAVARRLSDNCDPQGVRVFRFGGEEFAMLLPKMPMSVARQFAESVRRGLEKLSVLDRRSGKRISKITASFGVAERQNGESLPRMIERADEQLYKAKELGRNRVMPIAM